jgi:hypothetical protein
LSISLAELNTGHQSKDRVFKYQHQYRGHRAQPLIRIAGDWPISRR